MRRYCLLLTILLAVAPAAAQEGDPDPRVAELERLAAEATELQSQGDLEAVAVRLERAVEVETELHGTECAGILGKRAWLANVRERLGDFEAAKAQLVEVLRGRTALSGEDHWETVRARIAVEDLERRAGLTSEERTRLSEAMDALRGLSALWNRGRYEEAIRVTREVIRTYEELLGVDHPDTAGARNSLAVTFGHMGRFDEASELAARAIRDMEKSLSADDPVLAQILRNLALAEWNAGRLGPALDHARQALSRFETAYGPDHPMTARGLSAVAKILRDREEYDEARAALERCLAIRERALGPEHPDTAAVLGNLGILHNRMGDPVKACEYHERSLAIRERIYGADHPSTAHALHSLSQALGDRQRFEEALPVLERAFEIRKRTFGLDHRGTLSSLLDLGFLHYRMAAYDEARPVLEQALAGWERVAGPDDAATGTAAHRLAQLLAACGDFSAALPLEQRALGILQRWHEPDHPSVGEVRNNLGLLYTGIGRFDEARLHFERALAISRSRPGVGDVAAGAILNNLASVHERAGDLERSRVLYEEALAFRRETLGEEHFGTAVTMGNLGVVLDRMGRYERAGILLERSLTLREKAVGEDHPNVAVGANNLAFHLQRVGESERALRLFERARGIWTRLVGSDHPNAAKMSHSLAILHVEEGRLAKARPLAREALSVWRGVLEDLASFQSERQQLAQFANLKTSLDLCLSLAPEDEAAGIYDELLAAKGLVFGRQAQLRALRARPGLAERFEEYSEVSRRLSGLLLADPEVAGGATRPEEIRALRRRLERTEAELAEESEVFRRDRDVGEVDAAELRRRLPADTALLDFAAYGHHLPREKDRQGPSRFERRYAAFVLTAGAEVRRVDLGPAGPIDARIAAWREAAADGRPSKEGEALRRLIWDPIAPHLGDATTVLVSPDGALSRIPFAALPGGEPGTWLVDRYAFATVPVPRLLPSLLDAEAVPDGGSLLLVGEVDYGAPPGRPGGDLVASRAAPRTGLRGAWEPLAATRAEMLAVRDSFELRFEEGDTRSLRRKRATEESFREAAGAHRWIHVATHGFFAPEEVKSSAEAGAAVHPGVLSGIVLAGANLPVESGRDDGILTALEVASLDFSGTELVTLSACETGLGEVAGGEGVLGLQRAFQMAGARSTVTSLWKVDDEFTRKLMTLFYEKLWDEGLPKAQALRQAQLALMADEGMRGLAVKDESAGAAPDRLPPLYWAGFTLSGDWR